MSTTNKQLRRRRANRVRVPTARDYLDEIPDLSAGMRTGLAPVQGIRFGLTSQASFSTTADAVNSYSINAAYDPEGSTGASQSSWYDALCNATTYLRSRVLAADVECTFSNQAAVPVRAALYLSDQSLDMSAQTSYYMKEDGKLLKSVILGPAGSNAQVKTIKMHFDFVKIFGSKVAEDDDYKGAYNANPADLLYLYVLCQSLDGSTALAATYSLAMIQHTRLEDMSTGANNSIN
jgi:hypothetical protein